MFFVFIKFEVGGRKEQSNVPMGRMIQIEYEWIDINYVQYVCNTWQIL